MAASTRLVPTVIGAAVLAGASAWLVKAAVPFDRVDPADNLDDLEPLRKLVGDARIVSLGEATHGTRECFQMKHRILRFLVERMGFSAFAIEATWPEANRLDRYVRTGEGDPAVLLSGLYFWTWNADEVLQMILWMRRHNESGGSVGFYGFDMQAPGMAIDNVARFVTAVDRAASAEFAQHCECLAKYANDAAGRFPASRYGDQPVAYRDACLQDLRWVQDTLTSRQAPYESASSPSEWARAVQSARVAVQFEEMSSYRRSRDLAMADNAKWLLDQLPAGGKIVLWAHNGHVATSSSATLGATMGWSLRQTFGQAMVVMGFSFAQGTFNAVVAAGAEERAEHRGGLLGHHARLVLPPRPPARRIRRGDLPRPDDSIRSAAVQLPAIVLSNASRPGRSFRTEDHAQAPAVPQDRDRHLRRGLQFTEQPHHGRHPVQDLTIHVQDHVAGAKPQPFGRPGWPDLRDHESIDHSLPALIIPVAGHRERGTQKFGQVRHGCFDRFSGQRHLDRLRRWRRIPVRLRLARQRGGWGRHAREREQFQPLRLEMLDDDGIPPDLADLGHVAGALAHQEDALPPGLSNAADQAG